MPNAKMFFIHNFDSAYNKATSNLYSVLDKFTKSDRIKKITCFKLVCCTFCNMVKNEDLIEIINSDQLMEAAKIFMSDDPDMDRIFDLIISEKTYDEINHVDPHDGMMNKDFWEKLHTEGYYERNCK